MKTVVIAGGTGFIGQYLRKLYEKLSYNVITISRQPQHIQWDKFDKIVAALDGAELLINLAGRSVDCRYHSKNRKIILESRTKTTTLLGKAIEQCASPPKLWINSSTATIYRHAEDRPMDETTGELGTGFSVDVAKAWEESFFDFEFPSTRQVALRISTVLGKGGGVNNALRNLTRLGLGGKQGTGKQKFSWVHIEDLSRIIRFVEQHEHIHGVLNCASPFPITNDELMRAYRKVLHVNIGIPTPAWLLDIGAVIIRTEPELVLKSRWVIPNLLLQEQFQFHYNTIDQALTEIYEK